MEKSRAVRPETGFPPGSEPTTSTTPRRTFWWMTIALASVLCESGFADDCVEGTPCWALRVPTNRAAARRMLFRSMADATIRTSPAAGPVGFSRGILPQVRRTDCQHFVCRNEMRMIRAALAHSTFRDRLDSATDAPCLAVTKTSHCPEPGVRCTSMGIEPSGPG